MQSADEIAQPLFGNKWCSLAAGTWLSEISIWSTIPQWRQRMVVHVFRLLKIPSCAF